MNNIFFELRMEALHFSIIKQHNRNNENAEDKKSGDWGKDEHRNQVYYFAKSILYPRPGIL
jgi:hypothetical protein